MASMTQPSLLEKLQGGQGKKRLVTIGGQLQEVTGEEIQSLAGEQGLQVPTSPLAAAAMGASPDQAKMVGDARQKTAALRIGVEGPASLATTTRVEQARTDQTEAERRAATHAQTLASLGGLGERVQTYVTNAIAALGTAATAATPTFEAAATAPEAARAALEAWAADRTNPEKTLAAAQALQLEPTDPALGTKLKDALVETSDVGALVAQGLLDPAEITFGSLATQLGYDTPEKVAEVEGALGLQPGQAAGLTVKQLQDAVAATQQQEFQRVEQARAMATDPNLSPAERLAAQRELRDLGAAGVRATEEDIANLAASIEAGDEVEFAGKSYTLEELLGDQQISGMIAFYEGLGSAEAKAAYLQEHPDFKPLADFAAANQRVIDAAVADLGAEANEFAAIQQANQQVVQDSQTAGIAPAILEQLLPGAGTLQVAKLEVPPLLKLALDPAADATTRGNVIQNLQDLASLDPALAADLRGMTEEQLKNTGIFQRGGKWAQFLAFKKERRQLDQLNPDAPDFQEQLARMFFRDASGNLPRDLTAGTGKVDLRRRLEKNRQYGALGAGDSSLQQLLDGDGDGKLDDPATLKQRLQSMVHDTSLQDLVAGKSATIPSFAGSGTGADLPSGIKSVIDNNRGLFADGELSEEDMGRLSLRDRLKINEVRGRLSPEKREVLQRKIAEEQQQNWDYLAAKIVPASSELMDPAVARQQAATIGHMADGLEDTLRRGEFWRVSSSENEARSLLQRLRDAQSSYAIYTEAAFTQFPGS